jgi:hypothetical protein
VYSNREQLPYQKWHRLHVFLDNPTLKAEDRSDANLKHRALADFELIHNKLYKKPDKRHSKSRYFVPGSEAFDTIAQEHLKLLHAGRHKVWAVIEQQFYGIKREDVEFILKRCKNCALNRPAIIKAPLVPIISGRAWERV